MLVLGKDSLTRVKRFVEDVVNAYSKSEVKESVKYEARFHYIRKLQFKKDFRISRDLLYDLVVKYAAVIHCSDIFKYLCKLKHLPLSARSVVILQSCFLSFKHYFVSLLTLLCRSAFDIGWYFSHIYFSFLLAFMGPIFGK